MVVVGIDRHGSGRETDVRPERGGPLLERAHREVGEAASGVGRVDDRPVESHSRKTFGGGIGMKSLGRGAHGRE